MSRRFKVALPKEPPRDGKGHFVFAFKDGHKGVRVELSGQADRAELLRALSKLTEAMRPSNEFAAAAEGSRKP